MWEVDLQMSCSDLAKESDPISDFTQINLFNINDRVPV